MKISLITLFPEMFTAITGSGITGRCIKKGLIQLDFYNPRDFTSDVHHKVDDRPYGGGPGMVLMAQPLRDALIEAENCQQARAHRVCLSPQGRKLDQKGVESLLQHPHLLLVAGRYEGIDERFIEQEIDEEWSIGDYVLSGGELAAMVMIDSMIRLIPGSLGHEKSASEDSFYNGLLDYPHYTRPEAEPNGEHVVPKVLLSGNHAEIERWRLKQSLGRTWQRRPDLLKARALSEDEQNLLNEFIREQNAL